LRHYRKKYAKCRKGTALGGGQNFYRKPADGCTMRDGGVGFGPQQGEDAVTSRTIILNDSEYKEVAAALELMIDHCDAFVANGPADATSVRRQNCQAILQRLRSAGSG
jgi:hypothetical protein